MKNQILPLLKTALVVSLFPCAALLAQVPETIHYQGKVTVDGEPFDGTGYFKFAIIDDGTENVSTATATANISEGLVTSLTLNEPGNGYTEPPPVKIVGGGGTGAEFEAVIENGEVIGFDRIHPGDGYTSVPDVVIDEPPPASMQTVWSNDSSSSVGSEPGDAVALAVSEGIFSVNLGDVGLDGMTEPISSGNLLEDNLSLRVWFDDSSGTFEQLSPDQPLASAPYAIQSSRSLIANHAESADIATVANTALVAEAILDGTLTGSLQTGAQVNEASGNNSFVAGGTIGSPSHGLPHQPNIASGNTSFVGGGRDNLAEGLNSFVGGGAGNHAREPNSVVIGGESNRAFGAYSAVIGGNLNEAAGDYSFAAGRRAKVGEDHHGTFIWADHTDADFESTGEDQFLIRAGGGFGINTNDPDGFEVYVHEDQGIRITPFTDEEVHFEIWSPMIAMGHAGNVASATGSTVSGGGSENNPNIASGSYSTVGGGHGNTASVNATVGGGRNNVASYTWSTVGGGWSNEASGSRSTVGGGRNNTASGLISTVGGGEDNMAEETGSTVGGGFMNTASGEYSTVPGGYLNEAAGDYSFAAGRLATVGENHHGTFIWADSTLAVFSSTAANQFLIRAGGGVGINTNNPGSFDLAVNGSAAKPGGGSWATFSDQRLKHSIEAMNTGVLDRLLSLQGYQFEYKDKAIEERLGLPGVQIGFLAQEVAEVFPDWVDKDNEGYLYITERGTTALMVEAFREQQEVIEALKTHLAHKETRIAELENQLASQAELDTRLTRLETMLAGEELAASSD